MQYKNATSLQAKVDLRMYVQETGKRELKQIQQSLQEAKSSAKRKKKFCEAIIGL